MKLYIAESPLKAKNFAEALNANIKHDGYYQNNSIKVSWSRGHLVGLADPEVYDAQLKQWSADTLPILPEQFKLAVTNDSGIRKQFKILKGLMAEATEIICATDSDREGDLIFHYIYTLSGCKTPYKRILPSDLSIAGINKIINKEISKRDHIIQSAQCRSQSDWLIGINATRAITVAANHTITIGRVQTPTLALVCERFLANKNFQPEPYFPITIDLQKDQISFKAKIKIAPKTENESEKIASQLTDLSTCTISARKQISEKQPLPYYLSTLQIDASNKFGYSASQTLEIAQSLYEKHKLITYPRTDSGFLTNEIFQEVPEILKNLLTIHKSKTIEEQIEFDNLPTLCVNDKKAPNHHGIIPTTDLTAFEQLNDKELKIFDLLSLRFLAAFSKPCIKDKTKYEFINSGVEFSTTGSVTVSPGWRSVFQESSNDENKEEQNTPLPSVEKDESLTTSNPVLTKKMTKAPALLTEATLLQLMLSCGKKLDDESLKKAMEDNELRQGGLATEATRGSIIKNLFSRQLITNDKKKIIPSTVGLSLYEKIKDTDIAKPDLTAKWELKLDQIANGELSAKEFISEIKSYTQEVTNEMLTVGASIDTDDIKLNCPKCEAGNIVEGKKGYGCSRWNQEPKCDFVIWKNIAGKNITHSILHELIQNNITEKKIKGFKKKDKTTFDAFLKLTDDFQVVMNFADRDQDGETIKCPKCTKKARMNAGGIFCSDQEKCDFKLFRKAFNKKLNDKQLLQLLTTKSTGKIKGFLNSKNKKFDAKLIMEENGKLSPVFK
ncbi:MAG: DNA topoisomerase [Reichenbachiella sp.]|uniref:type IA DNA topoisomerase n=2 Tax=Reichenbachiella sp. TaxID=2184521 RepID=UPI003267C950